MTTMSTAFFLNSFLPATAFILMFVVLPVWIMLGGRARRVRRRD